MAEKIKVMIQQFVPKDQDRIFSICPFCRKQVEPSDPKTFCVHYVDEAFFCIFEGTPPEKPEFIKRSFKKFDRLSELGRKKAATQIKKEVEVGK